MAMDTVSAEPDRYRHIPLARHRLFQSRHLDQARAIVGARFCPHRLDQRRRDESFNAIHCRVEGRSLSLNAIAYGAEVEIEPGELGCFYLLQMPLSGSASIAHGQWTGDTGPGVASLLNPQHHTRMRWRADCTKRLIQIDRDRLHHAAERWLDRPLDTAPVFAPALGAAELSPLLPLVDALFATGERCTRGAALDRMAGELEEALMMQLFETQASSIRHLFQAPAGRVQPAIVRRARSHMLDHLSAPQRLGDIAAAAGTSARNLQSQWRRHFGCSPFAWLQAQRLDQLHGRLLARGRREPIAVAARACGLTHPGRTARLYAERFGCSPSETAALVGAN